MAIDKSENTTGFMLEDLSQKLEAVFQTLRGYGKLTEKNILAENASPEAEAAIQAAVPIILEDLTNPYVWAAKRLLLTLGPRAKVTIPELIKKLDSKDARIRSEAACVLAAMGPDAQGAVPVIVDCLLQVQGSYFALVWIRGLNRGVS